jgi:HEAT repeat protein
VHDAAEKQLIRHKTKAGAEQHFKRRFEDEGRLAYAPGKKLTELAARDANASQPKDAPPAERNAQEKTRFAAPRVPERKPPATANGSDLSKLSIEELSERLKEKDRATQSKAIGELYRRAGQGDEKSVAEHAESICKCLKDGDDATRETAARLLGQIRNQPAVPTLIDALDDSNAQVRSSAATALTRITRQLFGPSDNATPEERKQAVARWREWWSKQGKTAAR